MTIKDNFELLGKLGWLWAASPLHREWQVQTMGAFLLPPIQLGQYMLLERDGMPVGYCSWAYLDAHAEAAYILNPSQLRLDAWRGGDRLWFIDWVAPFGKRDTMELKALLAERFPDTVARAVRVKRNNGRARVMEFRGRNVERQHANALLNRSYHDFIETAKANGYYRPAQPGDSTGQPDAAIAAVDG